MAGSSGLEPGDFAQLIERSPDGIAVLFEGRYLYANPTWARQLGHEPAALIGRAMIGDVHSDDKERVERLLGEGGPITFEAGFVKADADLVFLELSPFDAIELSGRRAQAFIGRDVTRLKKAQARVLLADRMMSIGALAAGVAHEINNPLSYVLGNLTFLSEEMDAHLVDGSKTKLDVMEALKETLEGADRVRRIVRDLQAFSRADQEKNAPIQVNRVIESAVNMAWIEIRHRARLNKELGEVRPVIANEARLGQVILNLLLHAAHSLPEGKADQHAIRIRTAPSGERVMIEVGDNGPGLTEDQKRHLFDALPRGATDIGAGVGISVAHSIVADLGGSITVESKPGQGTTFRVLLPSYSPDPQPAAAATQDLEPNPQRLHILVVDDEPLIATALRRALKDEDVDVVDSGRRAIEAISKSEYDVIFCDLMMPELTGMDVYDWIAKNRPGLEKKIVLMTGGTFTPRAQEFLAAVPNKRLEKPFEIARVKKIVQQMK